MGEKKGVLGKFGAAFSNALDSADKAIEETSEKLKEAVKSAETAYVNETFEDMAKLTATLNELNHNGAYKSFKVVAAVKTDTGIEAILFVTKK